MTSFKISPQSLGSSEYINHQLKLMTSEDDIVAINTTLPSAGLSQKGLSIKKWWTTRTRPHQASCQSSYMLSVTSRLFASMSLILLVLRLSKYVYVRLGAFNVWKLMDINYLSKG